MDAKTFDNIIENRKDLKRGDLIPLLQEIQDEKGYISKNSIYLLSNKLNLPASKIYGVASFYNQFRFQPKGKYVIQVCRGTACHVKASAQILQTVTNKLRIQAGETTKDGLFSLEVVACIGACGLAPVISINGEFYAQLTPDKLEKILNEYIEMEKSNG